MADLEDRARRNHIRFQGIPENDKPPDLKKFLRDMITVLIPTVPQQELAIDRAHPLYLPERLPRDVMAKILFF